MLLTLLSASLYAITFATPTAAPLAWVALVPLFIAAARSEALRAAACGLVWGIAVALSVGWPLPTMLQGYFAFPIPLGWVALAGIGVATVGIYVAMLTTWLSWLAARGWAWPLLVAAGWVACEYAQANLLIGNSWALVAYSQIRVTTLLQIADLAGPYGVGMTVAAVNATVAGIFYRPLLGAHPVRSTTAVVVLVVVVASYGQWRLGQSFGSGKALSVAIVQGATRPGLDPATEARGDGLLRYLEMSRSLAPAAPDLVVWPESAVGFYLREHPSAERALFDLTRELGSELILGGQHYRLSKGRTYHHNSVFLVRDGAMAGRYDKLRLLPFAEERWFGIGRPAPTYSPGERLVALHTNHGAIGAFICFEAMYPDFARALVLEGAVVLLNLSNDVWFGYPAAARHQFDIALLRAIENRRYLVRASESGVSAVIDPYGRIVTSTRFGERGIISTRVTPVRDLTLYQRWGDLLAALAIAYAVAATLRGVLRPKGGDSPIARPAGLRLGRRRGGH